MAASSLFLPALIQQIDEVNKIHLLALFSACGMVVAAISNMLAGYLSDRTRSKFGNRSPWIVAGAVAFMLSMILASMANSIPFLLCSWLLGQVALNFIVAPMVAWIDFAAEERKGTASSAYGGLGMALGNNGFTILAAMFLGSFRFGFIVFGIITFIGVFLAVLIVKEPSNLNQTKEKKLLKSDKTFKNALTIFPKWSIGRDYYLALIGKLFQGISNFTITGYLLFILTDFMQSNSSDTQNAIQLINLIMLIFGILMGFIAGPICDKLKVLKLPVGLSTLFLGIGALGLSLCPNQTGVLIYAFFAGIGMGIWNSLDNLLNLQVIPDRQQVAFFLGIYNLGNTITQALAPIIAACVITLFGFSAIFIVSFVFAIVGGTAIFLIRSVDK
ncbi:MFS transporter [Gilliamella sp. B2865]|uniref:MFS transporter n=1 Tax=unclassified Gilliamella TaxID=2685620 RepID=UPI00226A5F74|nr:MULTISPECIES: MFS transporter [unclassified Gilliamella]MCX8671874.1 MFS transporter [Gilliamella sp. B2785]MCX8679113.1 MFS transporter [Gilliamella sp. B2865]